MILTILRSQERDTHNFEVEGLNPTHSKKFTNLRLISTFSY